MDLNKPETWLSTEIFHVPQGVDISAYQSKLDQIGGINEFGTPNLKLTYMPDLENYSKYYVEWDEAGFGIKTVLRSQFVYDTVFEGETPIDIPPPRWAIKEFVHPSQYLASETISRWAQKTEGQQVYLREIRPPRSDKGYYRPKLRIGKHNGFCCQEMKRDGLTCWGDYREPDESHLKLFRKAVKLREKEENQNPNEPLSEATMKKAALEAANEIKAKEAKQDEKTLHFITENLDEILTEITGEDFRKKAFSIPEKRSESGLIIL
jgi:hypothetical protein